MKLNRFAALGAIALLVVGTLSAFGSSAFAQTINLPAALLGARAEQKASLAGQAGVGAGQTNSTIQFNAQAQQQENLAARAGGQGDDAATSAQVNGQAQQQGNVPVQAGSQDGSEANEAASDSDSAGVEAAGQAGAEAQAQGSAAASSEHQDLALTGGASVTGSAGVVVNEAANAAALVGIGSAKITLEQAQAAALKVNPGATVLKTQLESHNGSLVYSVELSTGAEVVVDASTGAVLKTEASGGD